MTVCILTRAADGTEYLWKFCNSQDLQAVLSAIEFTGPDATFVRLWKEGEW